VDPDKYESGTSNIFFVIGGNMTIESGGEFESTEYVMITGFVLLEGIYNLISTDNDTFVSGEVKVVDGGSFTTGDHFSVTGNGISSVTDMGMFSIGDDLYIDGNNAFFVAQVHMTWLVLMRVMKI
jgi:hypothetical protein